MRVLEYDPARGAVLLERLGAQLHESGLAVREQIETIGGVLGELWAIDATSLGLPTTVDKATEAIEAIAASRNELGRLADKALALAERRAAAHDPARSVLLHGDAHAWNTLEDPAGGYRFVDPDGLVGEREYDLSISMREFTDELIAGDTYDIGRRRAQLLGELTGTDPDAIWEWGIVERVTNALLFIDEGDNDAAATCLTIAERWAR